MQQSSNVFQFVSFVENSVLQLFIPHLRPTLHSKSLSQSPSPAFRYLERSPIKTENNSTAYFGALSSLKYSEELFWSIYTFLTAACSFCWKFILVTVVNTTKQSIFAINVVVTMSFSFITRIIYVATIPRLQ